jgi:predicted RNA binding protein YcfA (HicA-like mRNA interferase family)
MFMSGKDFVKKLMKDGWALDRVNGSHHIMRKNGVSLSGLPIKTKTLNRVFSIL